MNIILLSGGSGKRLWPLSNDIRSKQFIKLFRKPGTDEYESMVQRVYRQVVTADPNAHVTIATSKTQVSAIRNQLGESVNISLEPSRRDTFPAIALATTYLKDELNVGLDEVVIVCPVDPYVENSYYESFTELARLVQEDNANLTLMGIKPTYPSEKYGYIIPEKSGITSRVESFKEKPDKANAEEYLKHGALWNAGIFGFKLCYMINKAHELLDFTDYRDLYAHYETAKKISFDYAVVEKENSIQVMPYSGEWKDVGTWNMMAEVMPGYSKGDVTIDEECVNTHVVNELDIPILVMGTRNLIVAASNDGILVSEKERSGYMKPYAEKIASSPRYAEKSWGTYEVINVQPNSITVSVMLKAGNRMSYHKHERRDEVWTIVSGYGRTIVDEMEQIVRPGDTVSIAAGCKHTLIADTDISVIEIQIGEISASDKEKYQLNSPAMESEI